MIQALMRRLRYRVTHSSKLPKGDVQSFFLNIRRRGFLPRHIVDVGANRGKWSRDAVRVFPDCAFTLVEPQIEMKPHLDRFCRRTKAARWILGGAGAKNGHQALTVASDPCSSSFDITPENAKAQGFEQRLVPVFTLDHLVEHEIGTPPDIVKIDAEGYESQIIQGAQTLLGHTEIFLLEAYLFGCGEHPSYFVNIVNLMHRHGYGVYDFTWFGRRPFDDGAIGLCEIAFARNEGRLRSFAAPSTSACRAA